MATYSINVSTPYQSTFLGNLDPNLFLNNLPNNTAQLIVPEDLRDAVYTIWENVSFKRITATGSSTSFIGIGGQNHTDEYLSGADGLKLLLGKPELSGSETMSPTLLDYSTNDTDVFIYNLKPDNFGGGGADQQLTKMTFLAGDNSNNLFLTSPYLMAQQRVGATAVDFTIYNEAGKITIDSDHELVIGSPNTVITLLYGTGSTGIGNKPGGLPGDVQLNLDNCDFGFVNGASGSPGDFLVLGSGNQPYWGGVSIGSLFTWNQVLTAGNNSDGKDVIITDSDSLYIGTSHSRFYYNGTYSSLVTSGELRIGATQFRLNVTGVGANKVLLTDGIGYAYWGTQSFGTSSSPHGNIGDVQLSGGSIFSSVNGLSASIGDVLVMGTSNQPYWGTQSLDASGLEEISEGGNTGWRLIGRNPAYFGNIGEGAVDFSESTGTSSTIGSTGTRSVTFGKNNSNPYNDTFMFGQYILGSTSNNNSGSNIILSDGYAGNILQTYDNLYNSVIGAFKSSISSNGGLGTAVFYESLAFGWGLQMYAGRGSAQIGYGLMGGADTCTVVGISNIDLTANTANANNGSVNLYNPRFIVGVGSFNPSTNLATSRKNGFVVMSDGSVSAPELTVAKINAEGTYSLITKEYLESVITGASYSPVGSVGDIQINGGTSFDSVSGGSASIGDILIMGATNTPYWGTQSTIFTEHSPTAYLNNRYKFTDTNIHGFYFGNSTNKRNGVDVWNDNTGNVATSGFVASRDSTPYVSSISMQFFGVNYYVAPLADKGAIFSTGDIINITINDSDFSWRSGNLLTSTSEVMRLDTSGLLTLPQVSIAEINAGGSYSVITKEYLQTTISGQNLDQVLSTGNTSSNSIQLSFSGIINHNSVLSAGSLYVESTLPIGSRSTINGSGIIWSNYSNSADSLGSGNSVLYNQYGTNDIKLFIGATLSTTQTRGIFQFPDLGTVSTIETIATREWVGATGASPFGNTGDLQINSSGVFGAVNGASGSIGDVLILGATNSPYWGTGASGLELITEGGNDGWRLIGRNAVNYANIGLGAIDFSISTILATYSGSTADYSITFGTDNQNNYIGSLVNGTDHELNLANSSLGNINMVNGFNHIIEGAAYYNFVNGYWNVLGTSGGYPSRIAYASLQFGRANNMYSARSSVQMGAALLTGAAYCTTIGVANLDVTSQIASATWALDNLNNPRLIVGNGVFSSTLNGNKGGAVSRSNAFEVWHDGRVVAPSLTPTIIVNNGTYSLITLEYLQSYTTGGTVSNPGGSTGDLQINGGGGTFSAVIGASGSVGDSLILGTTNTPYWGRSFDRVNDVGTVSATQSIDWGSYETWVYTLGATLSFTETNTPSVGDSKTITIYVDGNYTPTWPVGWTIKSGAYDGSKVNQIVVEWVKSSLVWANISN